MKRKWNDGRMKQVYWMALLGATDKEIAGFLEIDKDTLAYWKRTKPELRYALQKGKMEADSRVAKSFYKLATGYEYEEDVFFMYKGVIITKRITKVQPPNAYAAWKWLTSRRREEWADIKVSKGNVDVNIKKIDTTDFTEEELKLAEKVGLRMITEAGLNTEE